jgi:hypothetical protein
MPDTKFSQFLTSQKIHVRRILAASYALESLTAEDRQIRLNKRRAKKAEGENVIKETRKPRSGRPVTERTMDAALSGGPLSGPVKTRILKAINHLLEQKKLEKIDLRALF